MVGEGRKLTSLIPSLDSGSDGIQNNGKIKDPGMFPFMCNFLTEDATILIIEFRDLIDMSGILCH